MVREIGTAGRTSHRHTMTAASRAMADEAMKAVSPLADFSYDYHDLQFAPVAGKPGE